MKIKTKFCGEIECGEEDIISFEQGIPGFTHLCKFIIIPIQELIFSYMQSVEDEGICFIIIPPTFVDPKYDINISDETVKNLRAEKPEDLIVYAIVTLPDDISEMTANLRAPILINTKNNKAVQEVLEDERYNIRHKVLKEAEA
ncbi:MAG TPA: flagellar assembly protein FliW [Bacillota bacterium]|nr:flagellar assembly protein FliW [Bacillota bacterium]HPL54026.1 flagellar assembly protein FliW [Bacillota bacterium]